MTPQQKVIWTVNASPREQMLMLRLYDVYGKNAEFYATLEDIAKVTHVSYPLVVRCMKGLKELGWIESQRVYHKEKGRNLHVVKNCLYRFLI